MKNTKLNLNRIYLPLIEKRDKFTKILKRNNLKYKSLFCNNHYAKMDGEFVKEVYPIPVVEVENVGDFVFDFDAVSFEGYFFKKDILKMDLNAILSKFKNKDLCFYGETDCLVDLYAPNDNLPTLIAHLTHCKDEKIAINFKISNINTDFKTLLKLITKK